MPQLDKYIEMLDSTSVDTRVFACEQLLVSKDSDEATIRALLKSCQDPVRFVADAAEHALKASVHKKILNEMGLKTPKMEKLEQEMRTNEQTLWQHQQLSLRIKNMILVTTPSIEGKKIIEYFGIVSSEVVLGTGSLSELGGAFADVLGTRANIFQDKLKSAKDIAINELKMHAIEFDANAIIGVDLDYSVLGNNMLMVIANGTAVRVE